MGLEGKPSGPFSLVGLVYRSPDVEEVALNRRNSLGIKLLVLGFLAAATGAQAADVATNRDVVTVEDKALHATIFHPAGPVRKRPGILVIGGAEGGRAWASDTARALAQSGYVTLAEAYFNEPGLPDQLLDIPVEHFIRAIDRLRSDPSVDPRRIAVVGLSKGAEAALLLASIDRRVHAVVAGSPSDRLWQGIDRKHGTVAGSWTRNGRPLPYTPFVACKDCGSLAELYVRSRMAAGEDGAARIDVARINGPVLLTASAADKVWPSRPMAQSLAASLRRGKFARAGVVLDYPDGGHFTLGPVDAPSAAGDADFGGGTATGVVAAREQSWARMLAFLKRAFGRH